VGVPTSLKILAVEAADCQKCVLAKTRTQVVFGDGDSRAAVFFVGEGPGATEDLEGVPFIGRSGKLLQRLIEEELGLSRQDCYIANVVKCRPPENRDPKPEEIEACQPYLLAQIEAINPMVIVPLGNFASRLLLETRTGITKLRGQNYQYLGRHLVPTFHPAAALRGGVKVLDRMREDFVRIKELVEAPC